MTQDEQLIEDLKEWYNLNLQLKSVKAKEYTLRNKIFGEVFSDPVEGTNKHPLGDGHLLKATHVLNRKIDEGACNALKDKLREMGVTVESLVRYKPELSIKEYRALSDEQRKLFDQCLIVKPGSPSLEITLPKRK